MDAIEIKNATRKGVGEEQGYIGLSIRDERIAVAHGHPGTEVPVMATAWRPTGEERRRILLGDPVILRIVGTIPPPVMLTVGDGE